MDKRELREAYRVLWRSRDWTDEVRKRSEDIAQQLDALLQGYAGRRVGLYMALRDEPLLDAWLTRWSERMEIYLPRVMDSEQIEFFRYQEGEALDEGGRYRIREPRAEEEFTPQGGLDVVIVPAVAIDESGYRLGRGKGYYDRYLSRHRAKTIGVTLDLMPLSSLPRDPWDVALEVVLRPRN